MKFVDGGINGLMPILASPPVSLLEKSIEMAQKRMDPNYEQPNQVFFKRHGQPDDVGQLKQALPHTLSQGTLIPTTLSLK